MQKDELLKALSSAESGNWEEAHTIVQDIENEYAYWIHANLHREEGDISNSKYWYRRAGREYTEIGFEEEREIIFKEIKSNL